MHFAFREVGLELWELDDSVVVAIDSVEVSYQLLPLILTDFCEAGVCFDEC